VTKLHRFVSGAACALLVAAGASAQLNGAYAIDSSQPTGPGTYNTFQEAANDLVLQGVSGPVLFFAIPQAAPYAGFSIVSPIAGASATNTIEFNGSGGSVAMAGVAAGFTQVIHLGSNAVATVTGLAYVTIDGFDITVPATGAGISIGGSSNMTVRNCIVHGANTGAGISIVNSTNCLVENNQVYNVAATPGLPGSATYAGGISVYYMVGAAATNNVITRNRVFDCAAQGIFVGSSGSTTAPGAVTVTNNMVWNCVAGGTYPGGIAIRRSAGAIIAHNSVYMTGTANPGIHKMGSAADPNPAAIVNNIVKHDGTGACIKLETATTNAPLALDNNLYDPAATAFVGAQATVTYATLAAWQANALVAGFELSSIQNGAGFLAPNDLHISAASPAFDAGSAVGGVAFDLDGDPRPLGAAADIGADEAPATGLFANFSANVTSGPAPLTVSFTDQSFSSSGVTGWAWDFQNDGIVDSNAQFPAPHVYTCPGTYSVSLTVTDGVNAPSNKTRVAYITVGEFVFDLATTGGGVGDLVITPVPTTCGAAAGTLIGYTFLSFTPATPVGQGPWFGITPDAAFFLFLTLPLAPGNPTAFVPTPGLYPDGGAFALPAGTFSAFVGQSMDAVMVFLSATGSLLHYTNADRVTF
jgi:parallel beta-helix repeat protein